MSKLANHIALFCSHGNTGYLMKYIDSVLGLDQNELSTDLFVWDVISNPPIDLSPYEWNFDLDMPGQKFHHSLKEHHKISNIPNFRCEML